MTAHAHSIPFAVSAVVAIVAAASVGGCSDHHHSSGVRAETSAGCVSCHDGIEDIHAASPLGCTECHLGDATRYTKETGHVAASEPYPEDSRTLPLDHDPDYVQFRNPANLRIIDRSCGRPSLDGVACHSNEAGWVRKSLMATTAGHLGLGAYQNGMVPTRSALWLIMPVEDRDGNIPDGAYASLERIPGEIDTFPMDSIQRHYSDLPRKGCARCHLWSRGKATRGSSGNDGLFHSEGCAACHVLYAEDGLSESADPTMPRAETGHPLVHRITKAIPTTQCLSCHTRGARIGLTFLGLCQMPPGLPTGPDVPGVTEKKIYGGFHLEDEDIIPPDIHFERGMHCIDCHTQREIMGDGNIHGSKNDPGVVEIECEDCHGTLTEKSRMVTSLGNPISNLRREGDTIMLTSKVTGAEHLVSQVADVVNSRSPFFNARAASAMTANHLKVDGGLECYTCHNAWQPNCYGCHFERDLRGVGFDMLEGRNTPGNSKTDDKYFLRTRPFHMGINTEGRVSPYLNGCQVMTTVIGEDGTKMLDQAHPVTAEGKSRLGMNPVFPHAVRRESRVCSECHRNPAALGLGTESHVNLRRNVFVAGGDAVRVVDRRDPRTPRTIGVLRVPGAADVEAILDPIDAHARALAVAAGPNGVAFLDASEPASLREIARIATASARGLALESRYLYVADGPAGVRVVDLADPARPALVRTVPTAGAAAVALHGVYLAVADGPAGVAILDITRPETATLAAALDLNGDDAAANDARAVFPYSHLQYRRIGDEGWEKPFASRLYVADGRIGVVSVDLLEPRAPRVAWVFPAPDASAVAVCSTYQPGGSGEASREKDILYVGTGGAELRVIDVTEPDEPSEIARVPLPSAAGEIRLGSMMVAPEVYRHAFVSLLSGGVAIVDVTDPRAPAILGILGEGVGSGVALEAMKFDRYVDEEGTLLKDNSHPGARPFTRREIERILHAAIPGW